jgi:hypothetical protein
MRTIGERVSEKKAYDRDNWIEERVIDLRKKRFIRHDELYILEGSTTLDWENLGDLGRRSGTNGSVLFPKIGAFEDFLTHLIEPLKKKGEFCCDELKEGFYCLLDSYYGGIHAYGEMESDPHGRRCQTEKTFYPKRLADAQGYLRYVGRRGGIPALMGARVFSEGQ